MAPSLEGQGARSTGLEPPGISEGSTVREVTRGQIVQGLVGRLRSLERILRAAIRGKQHDHFCLPDHVTSRLEQACT